jgi:outer membrane lipoprotein SlyB
LNNSLNKILLALATITAITACSPKASTEDTSAQTKAIVDQAVAETKKQMLADQAAEKAKQEAQVAEDAAVAQAVADTKKEMAAEQRKAADKAKTHKTSPTPTVASTSSAAPATTPAQAATAPATTPTKMVCTTCGTVVAIHEVETAGKGSGLGVVAGGVVGGLLGNQVGNGSGRDLATIAGAIGGAVAGNKIEQNSKKVKSYNIVVKMETGEEVTFHQATAPSVAKGDAVRIDNNTVVKK